MKSKVFFLIAFIAITNLVKAQGYASMLREPGTWHVTFCNSNSCISDFYSSVGDTIINGTWYRFLEDFHFNRAVVAREDTVNGKVYFRFLFGQRKHTDVLMYDYSLEVNQSINIFNPNSPIPEDSLGLYDVVKVDSIYTERGYRKRLKLNRHDQSSGEWLTTTWVEGVGGLSYINMPAAGPDLYGFGELSCFVVNGSDFVYQSAFSKTRNECNIKFFPEEETLSLNNPSAKALKVYPNPNKGILYISDIKERSLQIIIIDNVGRVVVEESTISGAVDLNNINPGLYNLRIFNGLKQIHQQRFIKE